MRLMKTVAVVALALILTACGGASTTNTGTGATGTESINNSSSPSVVLKLGHIQNESDLWHLGAQKFADRVSELSGGDIKVERRESADMMPGLLAVHIHMAVVVHGSEVE